jgi:hypothetical protein
MTTRPTSTLLDAKHSNDAWGDLMTTATGKQYARLSSKNRACSRRSFTGGG